MSSIVARMAKKTPPKLALVPPPVTPAATPATEPRKIALEQADAIRKAEQAYRDLLPGVGAAFVQAVVQAVQARQVHEQFLGMMQKAAQELGIDPQGAERWHYSVADGSFVRNV